MSNLESHCIKHPKCQPKYRKWSPERRCSKLWRRATDQRCARCAWGTLSNCRRNRSKSRPRWLSTDIDSQPWKAQLSQCRAKPRWWATKWLWTKTCRTSLPKRVVRLRWKWPQSCRWSWGRNRRRFWAFRTLCSWRRWTCRRGWSSWGSAPPKRSFLSRLRVTANQMGDQLPYS